MALTSVIHLKKALPYQDADLYLGKLLNEIPWNAPNGFFHRHFFRYDRDFYVMSLEVPYLVTMEKLCTAIENSTKRLVSGVFCNYYQDGEAYTPYHADQYGKDIATLSLGTTRDFYFKHNKTGVRTHYLLEHGDLFYFPPTINNEYKHTVPIRKKCKDPRISLVFFLE